MSATMTREGAHDALVCLEHPSRADASEITGLIRESQHFHHPWVTAPGDLDGWHRYLGRLERDTEAGFLIRRRSDREICGVINLNIITYEALCSAYLSYYALWNRQGRGYMKEGLKRVIDRAFGEMQLHRLEANIQPGNKASIGLVQALGFDYEGYSPRFLHINGAWRDHERWALLAPD